VKTELTSELIAAAGCKSGVVAIYEYFKVSHYCVYLIITWKWWYCLYWILFRFKETIYFFYLIDKIINNDVIWREGNCELLRNVDQTFNYFEFIHHNLLCKQNISSKILICSNLSTLTQIFVRMHWDTCDFSQSAFKLIVNICYLPRC
jgi:hypothetical protein